MLSHILNEGCFTTRELGHLLWLVVAIILLPYFRLQFTGIYRFRDCLYQHLFLTVKHSYMLDSVGINGIKSLLFNELAVEICLVFLGLGRYP